MACPRRGPFVPLNGFIWDLPIILMFKLVDWKIFRYKLGLARDIEARTAYLESPVRLSTYRRYYETQMDVE
jgi:hypothetical protein